MKDRILSVAGIVAILLAGGALRWHGARLTTTAAVQTANVETRMGLRTLANHLTECNGRSAPKAADAPTDVRDSCMGAIYIWSDGMPLSLAGMEHALDATSRLGIGLSLVRASELERELQAPSATHATADDGSAGASARQLAASLVGAGATIHFPAVVLHRQGRLLGNAVAGYKTGPAYAKLFRQRMSEASARPERGGRRGSAQVRSMASKPMPMIPTRTIDLPVPGRPGSYFRHVEGHGALAYESRRMVHLLDLATSRTRRAPGEFDFIPSPDGQLFVTPIRGRGLAFYDADQVMGAARNGMGRNVAPILIDTLMRDQYPSVGVLGAAGVDGSATRYRVLTSWFDRIQFRDYELTRGQRGAPASMRPIGSPADGCADRQVSLPIVSPNGRELAARDEAAGTTKLFRLHDDGSCEIVVDLALPTGKVAWRRDAAQVAFAIPRGILRDGARIVGTNGDDHQDRAGIFVYDRRGGSITRIPDSDGADRLAFPDFVGDSTVVFIMRDAATGKSWFRLVCCLE